MCGHMLVGVLSSDDSRREDRIGGCETGGDNEGRKEVEPGNERIYEPSRNEPALWKATMSGFTVRERDWTYPGHDGTEQE